ncbi:MAG: peptide ABC transporter substrate-binding protein [Anaerolineae bacterium]
MKKVFLFATLALIVVLAAACAGGATTPPAQAPAQAAATSAPAAAAPTTAPAAAQPTAAAAAKPAATTAPAAAAPTAAAAGAASAAPKVPDKNVVRINLATYPDNLDPQAASFVNEIANIQMIYQPLVTVGPDLKPAPGAAESWTVSDDGLTYTFKLRDAKYSDGKPVTAKDFEYAWKRAADPNVGGEYAAQTYLIKGAEEYNSADVKTTSAADLQKLRDAMAVKAIDDKTLQFTLTKPAAYFPYTASLWIGYPVRQDLIEKCGENWWTKPECQIGNGPYKMTDLQEKQLTRFAPNPNWTGPKVANDGVEYRYINDSKVAYEAYKNGELDIIPLAAEDLAATKADAVLSKEIKQYPGNCTFALQFNQTKDPFKTPDARTAAGQAFDRDTYVKQILQGIGQPTTSWLSPDTPGYQASAGANLKFDAAQAKANWQKAGSPPEMKLTYSSSPRNKTRFEFIADQFQKNLGTKVTLDPVEATTYTALTKDVSTSPPIFVLGWCFDYPDPQNWLSVVFRSDTGFAKRVGWNNADFDKLVDQADAEKDPAKRTQLYNQAENLLLSQAAIAPLWSSQNSYLVRPYVQTGKLTSMDADFPGHVEPWKLAIAKQ